jgi:1-acyl-sn-glycerol-3-phosphate acyltransferase
MVSSQHHVGPDAASPAQMGDSCAMSEQAAVTGTRFWRGINHMIISVMHLTLLLTSRRKYRGIDQIPAEGGILVISNHVSFFDAFALPHAVRSAGRNPLGMGKIELFRIPILGAWFAKIGHVSVDRAAASPAVALEPAAEALRQGKALCLYPEGTVNTTPELGLVVGRTGVARLALASGATVVPVGQWGPQHVLTPAGRVALLRIPRLFGWFREHRLPRRPLCLLAVGTPIAAAELLAVAGSGAEPDLRAVTDFLMTRIGMIVADLSGIPASGTLGNGTPAVTHKKIVEPA